MYRRERQREKREEEREKSKEEAGNLSDALLHLENTPPLSITSSLGTPDVLLEAINDSGTRLGVGVCVWRGADQSNLG